MSTSPHRPSIIVPSSSPLDFLTKPDSPLQNPKIRKIIFVILLFIGLPVIIEFNQQHHYGITLPTIVLVYLSLSTALFPPQHPSYSFLRSKGIRLLLLGVGLALITNSVYFNLTTTYEERIQIIQATNERFRSPPTPTPAIYIPPLLHEIEPDK